MAPSNTKAAASAKDKPPRKVSAAKEKDAAKDSKLIVLKVSSERLRAITYPKSQSVKEETPVKDSKVSPVSTPTAATTAPNENLASDSNPATPGANGTPVPSVMGPPEKKKGVKRSAPAANGESKAKGKPGPKKRQRLEDGSLEPIRGNTHRLGPKANQGAINAGLRALDRSGKPCRKWKRGGFRLKTFTGVEWEIPRWTAPPKPILPVENSEVATPENGVPVAGASSAAAGTPSSAGKENNTSNSNSNKENGVNGGPTLPKSDVSNSGGDVEMQSVPSVQASSPAPMPIAAGA